MLSTAASVAIDKVIVVVALVIIWLDPGLALSNTVEVLRPLCLEEGRNIYSLLAAVTPLPDQSGTHDGTQGYDHQQSFE